MKRIAFVTVNDHAPWGGSEVFWTELAKLCNTDKFETAVSVAHWPDEPAHIAELRKHGSKIYERFPEQKYENIKLHQKIINRFLPSKYFIQPKLIAQPKKFDVLTEFKPDVVFISMGDHTHGEDWMRKCRELKIDYIIINQLVKDYHWGVISAKRLEELGQGYIGAKKVLFTSYDNKRIMEKYFFTHLTNTEIVNNPVKQPEMAITYPSTEKFSIANVAHLGVHHKGQDVLLETIASEKWQKRNVEFNLYGSGKSESIIKNLIKYWNIKNVNLRGFERIEKIWSENHILIMPSRYEGLSLAFLEALNCKRTGIVTNVGDTKRFIDDDVNGFIIKALEVELVDEALERAWARRSEWEEMGKKVYEKFTNIIKEDPLLAYYKSFKKEFNG